MARLKPSPMRVRDRLTWSTIPGWTNGGTIYMPTQVIANPAPGYIILGGGYGNHPSIRAYFVELQVDLDTLEFVDSKFMVALTHSGQTYGTAEFYSFHDSAQVVVAVPDNNSGYTSISHRRFTYGTSVGSLVAETASANSQLGQTDGMWAVHTPTRFVAYTTKRVSNGFVLQDGASVTTHIGTVGVNGVGATQLHRPIDIDPDAYGDDDGWQTGDVDNSGGFGSQNRYTSDSLMMYVPFWRVFDGTYPNILYRHVWIKFDSSGDRVSFTIDGADYNAVTNPESYYNHPAMEYEETASPVIMGYGAGPVNLASTHGGSGSYSQGDTSEVWQYNGSWQYKSTADMRTGLTTYLEQSTAIMSSATTFDASVREVPGTGYMLRRWNIETGQNVGAWHIENYVMIGMLRTNEVPVGIAKTGTGLTSSTSAEYILGGGQDPRGPLSGVDNYADEVERNPHAQVRVEKVKSHAR